MVVLFVYIDYRITNVILISCFAFALSEPFSAFFFSLPFIITAHGVIQNCLFELIGKVIVSQTNNRFLNYA